MQNLEGNSDALTDVAYRYANAYRIRRGELANMIENERKSTPFLWIIFTFIFNPILNVILSYIGKLLAPNLVQLVPQMAQAAGSFVL